MMNAKKIMAILMAMIMVLAIVPFSAMAQVGTANKLDASRFAITKEQQAKTMNVSHRDTKTFIYIYNNGEAFSDDFDGDQWSGEGWHTYYTVPEYTWGFYFIDGDVKSDRAIGITGTNTDEQNEAIYSPSINLTGMSDLYISFAYEVDDVKNTNYTVSVVMTIGNQADEDVRTVIAEVEPASKINYRFGEVDIKIPDGWYRDDVRFGFEYAGKNGTNVLIDNVRVGTLIDNPDPVINTPVYAYDADEFAWTKFDADRPEDVKILDESSSVFTAAEYAYGTIYGVKLDYKLMSIDPATHEEKYLGYTFNEVVTDMAFDYSTNKMFFAVTRTEGDYAYSDLYEMDISDVDHNVREVGPFEIMQDGEAYGVYVDGLAFDKNGKLVVLAPRSFFLLANKETGMTNAIFYITNEDGSNMEQSGFQSITYDWNQNVFYWPFYNIDTGYTSFVHLNIDTTQDVDNPNAEFCTGIDEKGIMHHGCEYTSVFVMNENEPEPPKPVNKYTVEFFDWNGKLLSKQRVVEGEDAVAPADPSREGYEFIGWDNDYTNVHSDLEVNAMYKKIGGGDVTMYKVMFMDGRTNELIAEVEVEEGQAATAPEAPVHAGYKFIGWDKDFSNVTENMIVTALYEKDDAPTYKLGDVDNNGVVEAADATVILRYVAKLENLNATQLLAADANQDGIVDSADATKILRVVAQLETL